MEVTASQQAPVAYSILKQANREPNLAGELIAQTVQGLMEAQPAQSARQTSFASPSGAAVSVDVYA